MLSIGVFSKVSNVTAKTLRYYDEIGLIKPIHVNRENGYRYYSVDQLKDILLINKLKMYSFSLDEIAQVLKNPHDESLISRLIREKHGLITEKLQSYNFILRQLEKDMLNIERGINIMSYMDNIQVKLVETKPRNILFFRQKMNINDYGKYMSKLFETVAKDKLTITAAPMTIYHDVEFNPLNNDTEIAIPVKEVIKGTRELAGGLCAMGTLKGPYTQLTSLYAKIMQWIEDEGYTIADSIYEIYLTDPRTDISPEEYVTEVYVPVKK